MSKEKQGYKITPAAKRRFKIWLLDNNLSVTKFAKKCGVTRQYISAALDGKIKCTDSVIETFKKGGYELI